MYTFIRQKIRKKKTLKISDDERNAQENLFTKPTSKIIFCVVYIYFTKFPKYSLVRDEKKNHSVYAT